MAHEPLTTDRKLAALASWILAIDFGTSYTVAAAKLGDRGPEIVEIGGERRMPSVVMVDPDGQIFVGRTAEDLSVSNPGSTLRALKNRLGDQTPAILGGRPYQVVTLVAALLRGVYEEIVERFGEPPAEVRLTHPATWNQPRVSRLVEAAAKAGLDQPLLVPEPVAAALSYAADVGIVPGHPIAVYDLGGGTFDSALVTVRNGGFTVVGRPGGDQHIGGELFDELMSNHIGEQLDPAAWEAIQVGEDPLWRQIGAALRNESRKAKEALSSHPFVNVLVPLPSGLSQVRVTRDEFRGMIEPYIAETIETLRRCIAEAGARPDELAGISLVGGSSRSPVVEEMVRHAFPDVPISRRGDPKATVAAGATLADRPSPSTPHLWRSQITQEASPGTAHEAVRLAPPPLSDPPDLGPPPSPRPPPVASSPPQPPPQSPPQPPLQPQPQPAQVAVRGQLLPEPMSPRSKRGLIGLVGLLVAAAIVAVVVVATRSGDDSSSAATGSTAAASPASTASGSTSAATVDTGSAQTVSRSSDVTPTTQIVTRTTEIVTPTIEIVPPSSTASTGIGSAQPVGTQYETLLGHKGDVRAAQFSPDSRLLVTAGADGLGVVWNVQTGKQMSLLSGHTGALTSVAFSPDGSTVATSAVDGTVRLWDTESGKQVAWFTGHTDAVEQVRFNPDGGSLVSAGTDGTVRVWDIATSSEVAEYAGPVGPVHFAEFSPNGQQILAGGDDGNTYLWNISTPESPVVLGGHDGPVRAGAFNPDGTLVLSGGDDAKILVWDTSTGAPYANLGDIEGGVVSATFSNDGTRLMASGHDRTAALWDVVSTKLLGDLAGHDDNVVSAEFSPDDNLAVTASADGTARIWDVSPGTPIGVTVATLTTGGSTLGAVFSPDGKLVATIDSLGVATIWAA
ncbi:MAG: Heat shock protein 70 [Acidimicrobiales bacterium]|nr:Heat shock protein 70 [Acidimicrobiales bacterium]